MKKITVEVESYYGNTIMAFEIGFDGDKVEIFKTQDCNHADTDEDYIFDTDNDLIRIQAEDKLVIDESERF